MLPGFNGQLENKVLALVDELLRVHPHLLRQVSELENKTSKLMRGGGGCQRGTWQSTGEVVGQMLAYQENQSSHDFITLT